MRERRKLTNRTATQFIIYHQHDKQLKSSCDCVFGVEPPKKNHKTTRRRTPTDWTNSRRSYHLQQLKGWTRSSTQPPTHNGNNIMPRQLHLLGNPVVRPGQTLASARFREIPQHSDFALEMFAGTNGRTHFEPVCASRRNPFPTATKSSNSDRSISTTSASRTPSCPVPGVAPWLRCSWCGTQSHAVFLLFLCSTIRGLRSPPHRLQSISVEIAAPRLRAVGRGG